MRVELTTNNNEKFAVCFPDPTEKDLESIDGPEVEGQTTPEDVYVGLQLLRLSRAIWREQYTLTFKIHGGKKEND